MKTTIIGKAAATLKRGVAKIAIQNIEMPAGALSACSFYGPYKIYRDATSRMEMNRYDRKLV